LEISWKKKVKFKKIPFFALHSLHCRFVATAGVRKGEEGFLLEAGRVLSVLSGGIFIFCTKTYFFCTKNKAFSMLFFPVSVGVR
jgi:hypothetical protein